MVTFGDLNGGRVVFRVESAAGTRIASVHADLIGDGEPGWTVETIGDATWVAGVRYRPTRRGLFNLIVSAIDANGCQGSTGARRDVLVK